MKQITKYILVFTLFFFCSCEVIELDNYDEPKETIEGEVVDIATGEPVYTDQGAEGIRVRLTELSWGDNVTPNPDFFCMPNGTFRNTKIFKGEYNINIDGPFIPLLREDQDGVPLANETMNVKIEGVKKVKFEVQPFLKVEWVDQPTIINGKIKAKVKITRAISKEDFRSKIEPMGGYKDSFVNITDIQLFVSYSSTVGYRARDERWSNKIEYTGSEFENLLGQTITIESNGEIPSGRKVYIRAAARINFDTPRGSGTRRWNYNMPLEILMP